MIGPAGGFDGSYGVIPGPVIPGAADAQVLEKTARTQIRGIDLYQKAPNRLNMHH
jgi:hypothetical protein